MSIGGKHVEVGDLIRVAHIDHPCVVVRFITPGGSVFEVARSDAVKLRVTINDDYEIIRRAEG